MHHPRQRDLTPSELLRLIEDIQRLAVGCHVLKSVEIVAQIGIAAMVPPGTLRISVVDVQEGPTIMIRLPEHKTFATRKTPLAFQPVYLKPVEGGDPVATPDDQALVSLQSSDPNVGVEQNPETGAWFITTPADSGNAIITITASSPNADYEGLELPYSYGPPVPGQINLTIGTDVAD